jgi:hypothetical protein
MRSYQITGRKRLDLSPVFGPLERAQEERVFEHLRLALERVRALQGTLAERTGGPWVTRVTLDVIDQSGQACISGWVETSPGAAFALTFEGELRPRNFYDDDPKAGTLGWSPTRREMATDAWDVEGLVYVYPPKQHRWDPHQEVAVELAERRYHSPEEAAAAYADLWAELTDLALSRPLDSAHWKPDERG